MILAGQLAGEDNIRRFRLEAEAAANLDHSGIVPIYEFGEHDGRHFFSMGFVEGTSLAAKVADGPLPPREAASLTMQIAGAMQYAHERDVIHRDLKPANVLVDRQGRPRVTDFGLAKRLRGDSSLTHTGQVMGTPSYMPPEQAEGRDVGPAVDVYALGAILYCLLTGRPPFQAASPMETLLQVREREPVPPRQLNPGVPRDLETIALKCLQKQPGRRYESAAALAADLERWLQGETILARPVGRPEKVAKWVCRRPVVAALGAAVVAIGLAGLSGIVWQWRRAERNFAESEKNRKLAQTNYEEARSQRKIAEARTIEVQARADELERQAYVSLIAVSHRESREHNVALSDRLLERCPPHLRGWEWRYVARANHAEVAKVPLPGGEPVRRVVPSPESDRFACFVDKLAWVSDLGGKKLSTLDGHPDLIESIAWSPDGKTIATGAEDREIRLWDAATGEAKGPLRGHGTWVVALAFSPDGKTLLSGAGAPAMVPGRCHEVKLWDLAERREIHTFLSGSGGGVQSVAFSPDGKRVAAGTIGGGAYVWDLEARRLIHEFVPSPHQGKIYSVSFSHDGRLLATGSEAGLIGLWDIEKRAMVRNLTGHDDSVLVVRLTRDGRRLASCGRDTTIRLWDAGSGRMQATFQGHSRLVDQLEFDRSESRLFSSSSDGTIRVWDATIETRPVAITGHTGWTNTLAFHPDGRTLSSGGWGGLFVWDAASGRRLGTIRTSHYGGPAAVAYRPDGGQIAAVGENAFAQIFDANTRRLVRSIDTKFAVCSAVAFSPDGASLIVGDKQGNVQVLDAKSGAPVRRFRAHEGQIVGFSLDAGGARLVTASPGDEVKVWDLAGAREPLVIKSAKSSSWPTSHVAVFDPSGRRLAVRKENNTVAILDAGDGRVLRALAGHSDEINAMAFSPDGRRLATAGTDKTVRLWDPDRGEELLTLLGRQGSVSDIAWSRDGRYLAAVGVSEGQIWDAGPPDGTPPEGPAARP
jgi:WD40 repeat protein